MAVKQICSICLEEALTIYNHHTSYFPEKTIKVCSICHSKLHKNLKSNINFQKECGRFYKHKIKSKQINNKDTTILFNFLFNNNINYLSKITWTCPICNIIAHDKLFLRQHVWDYHNICN